MSLLEFPCDFPIKAVGVDTPEFRELVVTLVDRHLQSGQRKAVRINPSRNGRYISVTVTIRAESQDQLDSIYSALSSDERVIMAL